MGMFRGQFKELSGLCSLLVPLDLGVAWAYKLLHLQAKKERARTTDSILFLLNISNHQSEDPSTPFQFLDKER